MKFTILSLMLFTLLGCGGENSQIENLNSQNSKGENELQTQESDELLGTWCVKEILINGESDLENYPVNNDELTFNSDMSVFSIDKTLGMREKGTWNRYGKSQFSVNTGDETVVFKILKINSKEMTNQMVTDKIDLVIKYSRKK